MDVDLGFAAEFLLKGVFDICGDVMCFNNGDRWVNRDVGIDDEGDSISSGLEVVDVSHAWNRGCCAANICLDVFRKGSFKKF